MNKFGFLLHPLSTADVARKYPIAQYLPASIVEAILNRMSPKFLGHISDLGSDTGASADGCFVGVPATPRQFAEWPPERSYDRILQKRARSIIFFTTAVPIVIPKPVNRC